MSPLKTFAPALLASTALASFAFASPVTAQDTARSAADELGEVIVTGSRFGARTSTESTTPVDAISRETLQQSGRVDLIQMLKVQVPSFNSPRPLGSGVVTRW